MCVSPSVPTCGSQRATCWNKFSPSTLRVGPKVFVWIAVFSKSSSETLEPLQPASKAFFLDFFLFIPFCGSYLEFSKVIAISVLI